MSRAVAWLVATVLALSACSPSGTSTGSVDEKGPSPPGPVEGGSGSPSPSGPVEGASRSPSPSGPVEGGSGSPSRPAAADLPPVTNRVSLAHLMRGEPTSGRLRVVREAGSTDAYRRYEITYPSGRLTISGVLLRPRRPGRLPGVVLNHGHIEPSVYVTGQGLRREQDRLAREGFVVLHTDYRGHAASSPAPEEAISSASRLGYTRDAINAAAVLKREAYVDPGRLAMLGRSMGGGVTLGALVARPGLVRAAVLYASVSSDYLDNLRRWMEPRRPGVRAELYRAYGGRDSERRFYAGLSPRTYFDRITEPVLMFHGTSDDQCPLAWSRTTDRLLRRAGVDSDLVVYDGEQHAFGPQWEDSIRRTIRFLRAELG